MIKTYCTLALSVFLTASAFSQIQDGTTDCPFGPLPYRLFFPENLTDTVCVIHVSRGGNGLGDDRSQLMPYVNHLVQNGYAVVQVDHRFAGNDIEQIARFRGEEIGCIAQKVADNALNLGAFQGHIDGEHQGFIGHSGGCMEGLEAAGTAMTHGNYFVPFIKAVYGMSPAGFIPDQFGIEAPPSGYAAIAETAIFVVLGEQENNVNGAGIFMATDWRKQAYEAMNESAPRYQAFFQGANTEHNDISLDNADIVAYNQANAQAFFDTYVKNIDRQAEIGALSLPPGNPLVFSQKGLVVRADAPVDVRAGVRVVPNPTNDDCFVQLGCDGPLTVRIVGPDGRIRQITFPDDGKLEMRTWPAGLYFLHFECRGQYFPYKLMKY